VVAEEGGELVVRSAPGGPTLRVHWPPGYAIHRDGDTLLVRDLLGQFEAREGDVVHIGGGMDPHDDGYWRACGSMEVGA
jgi:hypothetical protein